MPTRSALAVVALLSAAMASCGPPLPYLATASHGTSDECVIAVDIFHRMWTQTGGDDPSVPGDWSMSAWAVTGTLTQDQYDTLTKAFAALPPPTFHTGPGVPCNPNLLGQFLCRANGNGVDWWDLTTTPFVSSVSPADDNTTGVAASMAFGDGLSCTLP